MAKQVYDIAVIGGGLAGLCLSIQAAQAGLIVVAFEKESYPFHKVCGEYISLESFNFLRSLGVPLDKWQLPKIDKLQASDVKGQSYQFPLDLGGFGVSRYRLDHCLYEIAVQHGVTFLTGTKVMDAGFANNQFIIQTPAGEFAGKVACGSFGKRSNLDIKWHREFAVTKHGRLDNYIGIKYHVRYSHPDNVIGLHNFHNGYCGISKIEDDISCLCYLTTANNLMNSDNSLSRMEKEVLGKNPLLRQIFSDAEFLYEKPLTISQVSFAKKKQVQNHVLMLGDAAGMITPLCGNGMSMAMHASKLATESIKAFIAGKISRVQMEDTYQQLWSENFRRRLWVGRLVQRIFGGNTSTSLFLRGMQAMPWMADKIIKSTHGQEF